MRKNKLSDIIFGLLLLAFVFTCLNGCGSNLDNSQAAYVPAQTSTPVVTEQAVEPQEIQDQTVETIESDIEPESENAIWETDTETYAYTEEIDMASLEAIKSVCGLTAPVEEDVLKCHWDAYGEHPYDVVYDYGEEYQKYVDACDWSLVFDAEYYMSEFPMLALQFHYDENELLFHFQTVGIHEGRQGCKDFNVCAYAMNGDSEIHSTFRSDYEGYYLYYMLNYDTEKNVNTTTHSDMSKIRTMYKFHPTALQMAEFKAVNADRKEVNVDTVEMYSEQCAFASYRAYLNAHDGWEAHSWAIENNDLFKKYCIAMGANYMAENTVTFGGPRALGQTCEGHYYKSKSHYEAMVSADYHYIGVSNVCNGKESSSQFDFFIDNIN